MIKTITIKGAMARKFGKIHQFYVALNETQRAACSVR